MQIIAIAFVRQHMNLIDSVHRSEATDKQGIREAAKKFFFSGWTTKRGGGR